MTAVLCIGGAYAQVNVDVEYNVHNAKGKILGQLRASSPGDALRRAKRMIKRMPGASFVTSVRDE